MSKSRRRFIYVLIVAGLATYVALSVRQRLQVKRSILEDHQTAIGTITDFHERRGGEYDEFLAYTYRAEGREYHREYDPSTAIFRWCPEDFSRCKGLHFPVIYSTGRPERSLIDLSRTITTDDPPDDAGDLDNYE